MDEFSLIDHFFKPLAHKRKEVLLGIGDDAACVRIPQGTDLLVSVDTLVSGVHFLPEWKAYDIACRSVLVNVSDMAAMAAEPCWITLALTLPEVDQQWLTSFAQGLKYSLNQFNMALIGGDTTQGPLSITLTIFGTVPQGKAVSRGGAKPGDIIVVSGELGGAALVVSLLDKKISEQYETELMEKLLHPRPRTDLIDYLRLYASAAIDISDGLSADLNHLCVASGVGGCIEEEAIPIHSLLHHFSPDNALDLAIAGGDDYELCFTVPKDRFSSFMEALKKEHISCYPIGVIEREPGLRLKKGNHCHKIEPRGYYHFRDS